MSISTARKKISPTTATVFVGLMLVVPGFSQLSPSSHVIANNTPRFGADAVNLGAEDLSKEMQVTLWLNQRNKAELDSRVQKMYQKGSPTYHQWLSHEEYNAKYAPSAQDALTVRNFLEAHNLKVSGIDRNNHFVTAVGKVADVQRAFQVQINRYSVRGQVVRANTSDPVIEGSAGALVSAVKGITYLTYQPLVKWAVDPNTGTRPPLIPLAEAGPSGTFFTANCFRPVETDTFVTPGGGPSASYTGNRYGSNINSKPPNLPPCGYNASEVQTAYGLKDVFKKWKGKGQTIIIVDGFGSPTIVDDTNAFSSINGLPKLTDSNFATVNIGGPTGCTPADGCDPAGWVPEVTLDVEWAHAIAPQANILLIQAFDNTDTNLDSALLYAAEGGFGFNFGNVVSNSWGLEESLYVEFEPAELRVQDSINELAASFGMSVDFGSGDDGDFSTVLGYTDVSAPADSVFATAVGGTSLFLNKDKTMNFQTGWGTNFTRIADVDPNPPTVPPLPLGFNGGAGGGTSAAYAKPSFQKSLSGGKRKLPDVAFLADPYTGVEIVITESGQQSVGVIGGTSLACPTFSAFWALANQAAGFPLGQAAALLYTLPSDAFYDVQQISSPNNPTGVLLYPPFQPVTYSAKSLAQPLYKTKNFVSAIYNNPVSTRWDIITFGTDTSLTTGVGWDNVTGLGTPNGLTFIQDVLSEVSQ